MLERKHALIKAAQQCADAITYRFDFDLDIACEGGIDEALEAAMALGPTSRALQDQGPETRAAVATSIRRALQPYQRGEQIALAGAIWLVTANNA